MSHVRVVTRHVSSWDIDATGDCYETRFVLIPAIALVDSFHFSIGDRNVGDLTTHSQERVECAGRIVIKSSDKYRLYPRLIHRKFMHCNRLICPKSVHQGLRQQRDTHACSDAGNDCIERRKFHHDITNTKPIQDGAQPLTVRTTLPKHDYFEVLYFDQI